MANTDHMRSAERWVLIISLLMVSWLPGIQPQQTGCGQGLKVERDDQHNDRQASAGDWPWVVSIQRANGQHVCGGTVIDQWWVITTAGCVVNLRPARLRVVIGSIDTSTRTGTVHLVHQVIHHDRYQLARYQHDGNDLALLQLTSPVTQANVTCLNPGYGVPRTPCFTTGWATYSDRRSVLMQARTAIMEYRDCMRETAGTVNLFTLQCAAKRYQQTPCGVSVGSPLVCQDPYTQRYDLWGIVSWNLPDCRRGAVYNLIATQKNWIKKTMINNFILPATLTTTTRRPTTTSRPTTTTAPPTTSSTTTRSTSTRPTSTQTTATTASTRTTQSTTASTSTTRETTSTPSTTISTTQTSSTTEQSTSTTASTTSKPTKTTVTTTQEPSTAPSPQRVFRCGQRVIPQIVNGQSAPRHSWPWTVSLQNKTTRKHFCGGSLIDARWILTAAHCVNGVKASSIVVHIGVHNITSDEGQRVGVEGIYIHRGFISYPKLDKDIALLRLDAAMSAGDAVNTVCLPSITRAAAGTCYTTGWGYVSDGGPLSDVLRQVETPLQNLTTCLMYNERFLTRDKICSGTMVTGTCSGDSGGPLMCPNVAGRYEVVGITSFGLGTCIGLTGSTMVQAFLSWIRHQTNVRCGIRLAPRIVGGVIARPHSWPWMVSVESMYGFVCGGVLIDPYWVLTSAHCVNRRAASSLRVRVGSHDLSHKDGHIMSVRGLHLHPLYNTSYYGNDIALVEMSEPVVYDERVLPICLPTGAPRAPHACYTTGWGYTALNTSRLSPELRQVVTPVQNDTTCRSHLGYLYKLPETTCAGSNTTGTCIGDTGAPLMCPRRGQYEIQGLVSFGPGSCVGYSGYVRVTHYLSWIRATMGRT